MDDLTFKINFASNYALNETDHYLLMPLSSLAVDRKTSQINYLANSTLPEMDICEIYVQDSSFIATNSDDDAEKSYDSIILG